MVLATKIPRHTSENLASDRLTFSLLYTYKKSVVSHNLVKNFGISSHAFRSELITLYPLSSI